MALDLVKPPDREPVLLADAKAWLRLDIADDDALVAALLVAARQAVERWTRTALIAQSWLWTLDSWPADPVLSPPVGPLRSVDAVQVLDASGNPQAVPAASWQAVTSGLRGRIVFTASLPAPGRRIGGIRVGFTAGCGTTADDVPQPLRTAILMTLARLYENRGDGTDGEALLPLAAQALAAPWRRLGVSP